MAQNKSLEWTKEQQLALENIKIREICYIGLDELLLKQGKLEKNIFKRRIQRNKFKIYSQTHKGLQTYAKYHWKKKARRGTMLRKIQND